jgi:hypothetical protein
MEKAISVPQKASLDSEYKLHSDSFCACHRNFTFNMWHYAPKETCWNYAQAIFTVSRLKSKQPPNDQHRYSKYYSVGLLALRNFPPVSLLAPKEQGEQRRKSGAWRLLASAFPTKRCGRASCCSQIRVFASATEWPARNYIASSFSKYAFLLKFLSSAHPEHL